MATQPSQSHSPSPSPPPSAPVALAPGRRAADFIKLFNSALDKTLSSVSYESFAACFPTIATSAGESLRSIHTDMMARLGELSRAEFQLILQERAVIANLNQLEDLILDARRRASQSTSTPLPSSSSTATVPPTDPSTQPVPPHTLPALAIARAHETPILIGQNSQLNARLQTVQGRNAGLMEEVKRQRAEIEALLAGVEGLVGDLERAGAGLAGANGEGEERSASARAAEGVLAGVE